MKSLILLIVTIWLLILNEEAYLTKKFIYRMNLIIILFSICLHTGIPNRINTHKVPGINTGYLPHHPTQKQNKIILTLTKVQYLPIPSITYIPSTNIIIPNTYIKVPRRGFWGFRANKARQLKLTIQSHSTHYIATIPYSSTTHFKGKLKKA